MGVGQMNKSILKHEMRSMKWMSLLSVLVSLFSTIMFNVSLNDSYRMIFFNGIYGNRAQIQDSLRDIAAIILVGFTIVSVVQIFMQFRSEKDQEVGRFLKSLPIKREEFLKIKLVTGLINISVAFVVLALGIVIVRNNHMFWIRDIHSISIVSSPFIKADGLGSLLKEIGFIYLIVLSFYTFLFMVQYTFTNTIGAIVTGILVWLAPAFIIASISGGVISKFIIPSVVLNTMDRFSWWLLPWTYAFRYSSNIILEDIHGRNLARISSIDNLEIKYIICLLLVLINIGLAYKFNKSSKVENENMIIAFKSTRIIFRIGVTICSGLLVSLILDQIIGMQMHASLYILSILTGGVIGYLISRKIAKVGNRGGL